MTVDRVAAPQPRRRIAAPPVRPSRTPLIALPTPSRRAPRAPFIVLILAVLAVGLVGLLLLNTALAQGSFRLHDMQRRTAALQDREQQLQVQVDAAGTPNNLATAARGLGLVPADDPGFLQLKDGKLLGAPKAATKPATKKPTVATSPNSSAQPTTAATTHPSANPSTKPSTKPSTTAKPTRQPTPRPTPSGGRR